MPRGLLVTLLHLLAAPPAIAALAMTAAPPCAADSFGYGALIGLQHDSPAVDDEGQDFGSDGSWKPLAGALVSWHGAAWGAETRAYYGQRAFASSAFPTDTPVRVDFLELGLVAMRGLGSATGRWTRELFTGPQTGLRLRARRSFRDVDQDVTDQFREADLKWVAGFRVGRRAGTSQLFLDGSLAWGLTNLDSTNQQEIHSRLLSFSIGWRR
ncbi:MAG TPA: outer membrane beta-barrel protein [Vicinamibacteria bacterium]|nr:outer membrane beta-barrel protein [Vicinamibacteria bacterium]